nr:MAG: replication associated protein [Arizlama virus]
MSRTRNVCFTSYDLSEPQFSSRAKYLVFQREKCPTTGRLHWQGYVEWELPMEYEKMSEELVLENVHYEARQGSPLQASEYCKKSASRIEGTSFKEYGKLSAQGSRTDITSFVDELKTGRRFRDVVMDHAGTYVKFHRGLEKLHSMMAMSKPREVTVEFYHGSAGVGKSSRVWESILSEYEKGNVYLATDHPNGWMDGYYDQEIIYFDDFAGLTPLREILRLCDRYPTAAWVKGGRVQIHVKKVIFTANNPPESMYNSDAAWLRRLTVIREVNGKAAKGVQRGAEAPLP